MLRKNEKRRIILSFQFYKNPRIISGDFLLGRDKLLFSKITSLVKGRGTIAILAMVEGFIIKIFVIKERIPQSFLTASG